MNEIEGMRNSLLKRKMILFIGQKWFYFWGKQISRKEELLYLPEEVLHGSEVVFCRQTKEFKCFQADFLL